MGFTTIGQSAEGRPIVCFSRSGERPHWVLVVAAMHGDEPKGVHVARNLIEALSAPAANQPGGLNWAVIPVANPDGFEHRKRRNAHRVDLNRNFPTNNWEPGSKRSRMYGGSSPASEPETRVVMRLIQRIRPRAIVTIHSIGLNRFCNNYDGPARRLAALMARHNGYPIMATIGYPTPGSFGTWAGRELAIPTITLELPSHASNRQCWDDNREALLSALPAFLRSR